MTARATTMGLTGVLALGGAVAAQEESRPPVEEAVAIAAPAFDWVRTDKLPGMGKLAGAGCPILMEDATFTPSGTAIVLGADIFCGAAGANAWRSDDGAKWTQEKLDYTRPAGLVATESEVVAVGGLPTKKGSNGLVWASEDGAVLAKAATIKNASLSDIIATPEGFEATGVTKYKQGYGFPAVWRSLDGKEWGQAIQLGDKRGYSPSMAIGPAGVRLAVDPSRRDGTLWRSEDGVIWQELQLPTEIRGKKDVSIWILDGDADRFVMVVQGLGKGQFSQQVWHSADGREWIPAAVPVEHLTALTTGPLGQFAFSMPAQGKKGVFKKGQPGVGFWSADGSEWCRFESDQLGRIDVTAAVAAPDGRLLLAGTSGQEFTGAPFVLTGTPIEGQTVPCEPVLAPGDLPETVTFAPPVIVPPSTAAACSDAAARATADASMRCISDLIKAGSRKTKPAKALKSAAGAFPKSACVKPAGGATGARAMLCLEYIAQVWRSAQREADAEGMVPKQVFDKILPAYQWAANSLSKSDKDYLDRGLQKLDKLPLAWAREQPKNLKKADSVRKAARRNASPDALRKTLTAAWLQSDLPPILDAVEELPGGWEQPDVPSGPLGPGSPSESMSYWVGPRGGTAAVTDLVSTCELALTPGKTPNASGTMRMSTCGRGAARAWLLYLTTGDERFIDVAVGIRDMAMRSSAADGGERLFFDTFDCWAGVRGGNQGCPSGL